jgi:Tfp pilus assembly protein PilN
MRLPAFLNRAAHTLLYITEAKTFRVDCDRKGTIIGTVAVVEVECASSNGIPGSLDKIVGQTGRLGRKTWILYARLSSYTLSLPSVQVEGVDKETLRQAIEFEFEGMTGLQVNKSYLSYHLIGNADDMSTYWVNLVAQETFIKTKEALLRHKTRIGGLMHPGGLPFMFTDREAPSWWRIECWSTQVFLLSKNPDQGLSLQIIQTAQQENWLEDIDPWILDVGAVDKTEALLNNRIEMLPDTDASYRLVVEDSLLFWLSQWTRHLCRDDFIAVPIINPQKSVDQEILYMIGGGLAAALLCGGHFSIHWYLRNDYQAGHQRLSGIQKEIKAARDAMSQEQQRFDDLSTQTSTLEKSVDQVPKLVTALQQRPAALLRILASHAPPDVVIENIRQIDTGYEVSGVSLQPHWVNLLASAVEMPLKQLGWQLLTPARQDMGLFAAGGPWEFSFILQDLGLEGFAGGTES